MLEKRMPTSPFLALSNSTDVELSRLVKQMLRETHYAALQRIRCDVLHGIVELSGEVPSFYSKQIAQEVLLNLDCVQRVENRLHVRCSP
jgi:osmotically-inducible protein OsmY